MNNKNFFETGSQPTQRLRKENPMNITKRLIGMIGLVLCGALPGYTIYAQPSVSVGVSVSLPAVEIRAESDFYEPLTPYGRWEVVGSYGRCWIPGRVEAVGALTVTATGSAPTRAGTGSAMSRGVGPPITMVAGISALNLAGIGCRRRNGPRPGSPGTAVAATLAGRRYTRLGVRVISPRAYVFVEERRFMEPVRPSTVVVNNTTSSSTRTVINEAPATAVIEKASGRKVQAVPVQELRHKEEAAVVAKRKSPASTGEKRVQTRFPATLEPSGKKTAAVQEQPQVGKPAAATHESAAPAPKNSKAQNANKQPAQPEKTAQPSDKKAQPASDQPAQEKPAGNEKNQPDKADKNQGNKGKD